ncbi:tetratricopeptide repeat protein [Chryseobacterium caseinilyticum]|uniref:Tetratricopeptide repeat protein n=1 Tax=Chryseobacterium caseinilyticum TaxID=2771428 RepID=A0ABR8ZA16_9FLAO|nr:tetratricopeptide repeat protein [Chryseobacterium caseinilyticum]MBD8082087.1 tetratricopeptide repeat protein [Chryseobacterium caseinilyticum]
MNTKIFFLSFLMFFLFQNSVFGQTEYRLLVKEGNVKFKGKDYDGASSKFSEAVKVNGEDFAAHYNLGNALYKSEKFEDAKAEFSKAEKLAQNVEDKAAALHNLGNAYMKLDDAEKAADAYKGSLKHKPYSEPTRKNYEIAMLKLKKEQRDKDQSSSSGKSGGGDDQNKGKDGDSKDKNQSQGKGQQNEGEGKNPEDAKKGNTEGRLSKENEKRLLDHIGEKEKQTARRILNDNSYSMPESNEKDW